MKEYSFLGVPSPFSVALIILSFISKRTFCYKLLFWLKKLDASALS